MRTWRSAAWVLIGAAALAPVAGVRGDEALAVGQEAPDFALPELLSPRSRWRLSDYVGDAPSEPKKLLLLTFFASWCKPCKKELPVLNAIYKKYKDRGLMVLDVNIDQGGAEAARKMIEEAKPAFPVLSDAYNILARRYKLDSGGSGTPGGMNLPTMLFIDPKGVIAKIKQGYDERSSGELEREVVAALGGGAPSAPPPAGNRGKIQ